MGLLRKAVAVAPSKGLLQRSLELLAEKTDDGSLLLTQTELDGLLANQRPRPHAVFSQARSGPAKVPLTWSDAGLSVPPERGPLIGPNEFSRLYGGPAPQEQLPPAPQEQRPTAPAADAESLARAVVPRITATSPDSRFPSRVFAILQEALSIVKGALLLYDPLRMVYAPWASAGYDTTTRRRLRIPLGAADSLNAAAGAEPLAVSGAEGLAPYQKYFSSREMGLISRIILAPFVAEDTLPAILLISEISPPLPSEESLLACLAIICRETAPTVYKAREERRKEGLTPAAQSGEPRGIAEELPLILGSPVFSGRKALLVSLTLKEYLDAMASADQYADPFRLEEELRILVGCFASDLGRVIQTGPGAFLLVLQDLERRDLDLLLHQLLSFLRRRFGEPDGGLSLKEAAVRRTRAFPDEEASIPALVTFFSG
jgi:hypothetical protein